MSRTLPNKPSLRYLKEEAKDLLKAQRRGEPGVCAVLRRLRRFRDSTDVQMLAAPVELHEAQFALAMEYGFANWDDMMRHVKTLDEAVVFRDGRAAGVSITGDRLRQDTFSLAVSAALELFGKSFDYRTTYFWSGNAFAPDIRPCEPTRGHWQVQGRERCLDVIALAAGVSVRPFPDYHDLADIPPMPKDPKEEELWLREYYAKPAASYLSHALQAGEVVVSCGEWAGARGLLWCDWGLIVEARSDGTILGAGPNGRSDNLITHIRDGWVLRAEGSSPAGDIRKLVLQRAVERIHNRGAAFVPGSRGVLFGLAAMDAWIAAMRQVPYDAERWQGNDHSVSMARQTALPTFEGARAAAEDLCRMAEGAPPSATMLLREAAGQYDGIVRLLTPALADKGPESYATIMGDPARQEEHVIHVLLPVRNCLAAAADDMAKALTAW
ncbi:MAG: hypothetical protein IT442_17870 [Phycisphaeraceae bacterium]|nr:hypothetical protein [Phycisphaeraceae bacterium]